MNDALPTYDELPEGPHGGRLAWGVFGDDDDLGTVNLLTPERAVAAAGLVRRGATFPLDAAWGAFDPPLNPARGNPRHHVIAQPGGIGHDDVWDNVFPQAGSQWDSLGHIGYTRETYYNGRTAAEVLSGRNTIDHWAARGIIGRGVLLDVQSTAAAAGRDYDPGSTVELSVADLEAAREHAGVEVRDGDVLLLHTGFAGWYAAQPAEVRRALPRNLRAPGLEHSEAMCRFLWDLHVAAIATDTFAVEAWPADTSPAAAPFGFIHQMLIGAFGMALGELWWLHDLAADCATDGVYEGLLVSAPSPAPGGIGSAPNAVFIK